MTIPTKELTGIAATTEVASGDPTKLQHLVPGMDSARGRAYMGNADPSKIREHKLEPNRVIQTTGDDIAPAMPAAILNQVYGIRFVGMADDQKIVIGCTGTDAFFVEDGNEGYETECLWDIPARNTEAWFVAVQHPTDPGKLLWRHK